jgi:predicted RNA-binding protein YlqC (UPF0109 family)
MSEPTAEVRTTPDVRTLVEQIAKALVDAPDEVLVYQLEEGGETVIELEVAPDDMGKVIGKHGRTAKALRCLVNATGIRARKRYALEILE